MTGFPCLLFDKGWTRQPTRLTMRFRQLQNMSDARVKRYKGIWESDSFLVHSLLYKWCVMSIEWVQQDMEALLRPDHHIHDA